jgi:phytoene synthase
MQLAKSEFMTPRQALAANGKSFDWARRFLGKRMGGDAATLYRFCRVLDDMADGDISDGPRRLLTIRDDLAGCRRASDPLLADFQPFIQQRNMPVPVIIALIDGLLQDQKLVRIADERALRRYAYRVAGTVGLLMCHVLDCDNDVARAHAIDLGIAMQLTNIARDVLEDAEMGRRYLPASWTGDVTPAHITAASHAPDSEVARSIRTAQRQLLLLADEYYQSGAIGLSYLPWRAHIAIAVAATVYRRIGVQIAATGYGWHQGRQVTSQVTKITCSLQACGSIWRRFWPRTLHSKHLHDGLEGLPYVR